MGIADKIASRYLGQSDCNSSMGKVAFEEQAPSARNIPKNHEFDKKALKPLSKALWACSVAQGHALTAYRQLSRLKSTTVSPDGLLGGRGYAQALVDMRKRLHEAAESLSSICDTLYDEATAPHWKPKLALLDEEDQGDISRFISEAQEAMDDPEAEAEEEMARIEGAADAKGKPPLSKMATALWSQDPLEDTSPPIFIANSSVSPDTLGGGPRVDSIGPGEGEGPYGSYNKDEPLVEDQWSFDGGGSGRRSPYGEDYDYPSPWENRSAASGLPIDDTPTEAQDFGLGYGASGQGAQHGNPSGEGDGSKGVLGPQSGLPGPFEGLPEHCRLCGKSLLDNPYSRSDPSICLYCANRRKASNDLYGSSLLPQDVAGPVSRSDYYTGENDSMVSTGASELPAPPQNEGIGGQPLMNTYYTQTDMGTDLVRWDGTTKTLKEPTGDHLGQEHQEPWAPDGEATR